MRVAPIDKISYKNTLKAFQPYYKETLTVDDAIDIQNNLIGLCNLLRKNKQKQDALKNLC